MKDKQVYACLSLAFALILVWIYWYEYRPIHIRIKCSEYAIEKARDQFASDGPNPQGYYYENDRSDYFNRCLDEAGLERRHS